ncbi:MAG: LysE family transporter [Bacteroidota bacterium]
MLFQILLAFTIATVVSAVGTLPPATINVSVLQLAIRKKQKMALQLATGAALIDLIYTALSLEIGELLETQEWLTAYFQLISAIVIAVLGVASILAAFHQTVKKEQFKFVESGFIRGVLLGVFNPLVMPFWLAITTYLKSNQILELGGFLAISFLIGTFIGELGVLIMIVKLGKQFTKFSENKWVVGIVPGILFIVLGIISVVQYLLITE